MKNSKLIFFGLFLIISVVGKSQSKADTLVIKTQVQCDHCKTYETCGLKFERDLYLSKGIKDARYNSADTTIVVVYRSNKTNPVAIRQLVSKMGFDADDVPADPKAYDKLDDCCRLEIPKQ